MTLMRVDSLFLDGERRLRDLAQLAVDAEAHAVVVLVGLEVQVGGAHADRVEQHLLQEAHDRRVFDVGSRRVFGGLLGDVGQQIVEIEVVAADHRRRASALTACRCASTSRSSLSCSTMTHVERELGRELDLVDRLLVGRVGHRR